MALLAPKMAGGLEGTRTPLPTESNSAVFTVRHQATEMMAGRAFALPQSRISLSPLVGLVRSRLCHDCQGDLYKKTSLPSVHDCWFRSQLDRSLRAIELYNGPARLAGALPRTLLEDWRCMNFLLLEFIHPFAEIQSYTARGKEPVSNWRPFRTEYSQLPDALPVELSFPWLLYNIFHFFITSSIRPYFLASIAHI